MWLLLEEARAQVYLHRCHIYYVCICIFMYISVYICSYVRHDSFIWCERVHVLATLPLLVALEEAWAQVYIHR